MGRGVGGDCRFVGHIGQGHTEPTFRLVVVREARAVFAHYIPWGVIGLMESACKAKL